MLEKLEKKFRKYSIKNLIYYVLGAYVIGYILYMAKPEWYNYIVLNPALVMKGQVWRLFSWILTIPADVSILLIFMFLFYFFIGRTLEAHMGRFRYNLYIFSGWLFTTLGAMIYFWLSGSNASVGNLMSGYISTNYINLSSFLAFALVYPDARVLVLGIIPVRMKILAWIDAIYLGLQVTGGIVIALSPSSILVSVFKTYYDTSLTAWDVSNLRSIYVTNMVVILISMLNFLLFFLKSIKKKRESNNRRRDFENRMNQGRKSASDDRSAFSGQNPFTANRGQGTGGSSQGQTSRPKYRADSSSEIIHKCSICGRTNITNPELMFRYCSKCSGNHEYCQDHLFTHEHVKN